jgi:DNA-binding FadR family transcriptional regulator
MTRLKRRVKVRRVIAAMDTREWLEAIQGEGETVRDPFYDPSQSGKQARGTESA